jgi:nitrogen regulatory protein PII
LLLLFVLDNPCHLEAVLDAWTDAGVPGVTILESTGVHRKRGVVKAAAPLFLGMSRLIGSDQYAHCTLLSVIEDDSIVPRVAAVTEAIVGDLRAPHTGLLFTLPVQDAWGFPKASRDGGLQPHPCAAGE